MKNTIIAHDKYAKALTTLTAFATAELQQFMVFLIEISRVGKTTLLLELLKRLPSEFRSKVIRFECPPKMTAQFTIKPFLLRYLEHLGDPFSVLRPKSYQRMKNDELINLITQRIKQKGIRLVVIDEADLFVTVRGHAQAYENLQFLKSLVNISGIPHVFAGTPPLAEFLSMEGQIINRSHVIKLSPYNLNDRTHQKIFLQILSRFEKELQLPLSVELKQNPEVLFSATNGCIGALKELLVRIEVLALAHDQKAITEPLIKTFGFHDPDNLRKDEIEDFHKWKPSAKKSPTPPKTPKKSRNRGKPGQRNNPIDEVGGEI